MAASISGRQVVWGVPSDVITAVQTVTTSGIIQDFTFNDGGNTEEVPDEDGDFVARVDYGKKNSLSFTVVAEDDTVNPEKGDELTFAAAVDGIALDEGRIFVETAEVVTSNSSTKRIAVTASHYPDMEADPA